MPCTQGCQQFHKMGGIFLGTPADAETIAGLDVAADQIDMVKATLPPGAEVLKGGICIELEVAGFGMHASIFLPLAFEIEVGKQQ